MLEVGVVIRGTKGGFHGIYTSEGLSENDKMSIIYDERQSTISESLIGKECYGLSFSPNGKVFTIFRVMYDGNRSMAVGFLGISVFVPFELIVDGQTVKLLLDKLMIGYCHYAPENKLGGQNEDWGFIQKVLKEYQAHFKRGGRIIGSWLAGAKDAAYLYYTENLLGKYFEDVFQSLYKNYRQILLIDEKSKNINNILLALKHSDNLSGQIDIENPRYDLNIKNLQDQSVEVKVNGHKVQYGEKVALNQLVEIKFSRPYHNQIIIEGTYHEVSGKYSDILNIDDFAKKITINSPFLEPEKKIIKVNVFDAKHQSSGNYGISISCKSESSGKVKHPNLDYTIRFEGLETSESWVLKIGGGEKYNDDFQRFIPKDLSTDNINFRLKEKEIKDNTYSGRGDAYINLNSGENPTVQQDLSKKTWWQRKKNYVFIVSGLAAIPLLYIIFSIIINYWIPGSPPQTHDTGTVKVEPMISQSLIATIEIYTDGMDLKLDSLHYYRNILLNANFQEKTSDSLRIINKIDNAVKIRSAINGNEKDSIKGVYKLSGLSNEQNGFLKLISDNDFEYFKSITNRNNLSLSDIKIKLDSIINETKEQQVNDKQANPKFPVQNPVIVPKIPDNTPQKNVPKGTYSKIEFINIILSVKQKSDLGKLSEDKLTDYQKTLRNKIKGNPATFIKKIPYLKSLEYNDIIKEIDKL